MVERNAGLPPERLIEFRIGIHLGNVVEEADGDLMGDGINIAARLEGICESAGIVLSNAAYEHARDRVKEPFIDLGEKALKSIERPVRAHGLTFSRSAEKSDPISKAALAVIARQALDRRLALGRPACRQCLGDRGLRPRVQLLATHKRVACIAPRLIARLNSPRRRDLTRGLAGRSTDARRWSLRSSAAFSSLVGLRSRSLRWIWASHDREQLCRQAQGS
jgi:hypothetical protein